MKPLRFVLMTAALLALAVNATAQTPQDPDLRVPYQNPFDTVSGPGNSSSGLMPMTVQQALQKVQSLYSLCTGQNSNGVTGSITFGISGSCKGGTCCAQSPGCAKGCETAQAPKACCCAKACACCETCQAKKDAPPTRPMPPVYMGVVPGLPRLNDDAASQMRPGCPMSPAYGYPPYACSPPYPVMPPACPMGHPMPVYSPPAPPMPAHVVQIHGGMHHPLPAPPLPMRIVIPMMQIPQAPAIRIVACTASAPAVKHAHLVTPDLEAHAARMTHRGDTIVLEGDVLLLCKKHAQPIRIEAQRVIVNMKDGTFTVDSEARPVTSGFGVLRTSAVAPIHEAEMIFLGNVEPLPRQ